VTSSVAPPTPIVIVSGPPASGKTHVADVLANRLALPLIAKDSIKEVLYDSLGTGDVAWSQRLGRAALAVLYQALEAQLRARRPVVVEANFAVEHARPVLRELQERCPFAPLEIHCTARDGVLIDRYTVRAGSRHAGHLDELRVEEITSAIAERLNRPLELNEQLMVLDTSQLESVDLEPVVEAAREHVWRRDRN
jgi:predicted kinase